MQPSAPPLEASAPPMEETLQDWRLAKLSAVAAQLEIRADWVARLRSLEGFCITILCDDSGSMATVCDAAATATNPYARQNTRWDELRGTVSMLVQLATALDPAGAVDIFFLNRPPLLGVQDAAQLQGAFANPPQGYTPLTRMFAHILQAKAQVLAERRLLLIIATDGQPTDDNGNVHIPEFLGALMHKPQNMHVQIMACTDDEESMAYLNEADRNINQLDVCDDFLSERREVLAAQGPNYHFTRGDYITKAMLGAIDPFFDNLDHGPYGGGGSEEQCCALA